MLFRSVGKLSVDRLREMNDEAFRERVKFLRAEAKRLGRDPDAIKISNVMLVFMVVDTAAAARQAIEGMCAAYNIDPEVLLASPVVMIGTPEQCATELKRRAKNWGVSQFVFSSLLGMDEKQIRRVREEIIPQI